MTNRFDYVAWDTKAGTTYDLMKDLFIKLEIEIEKHISVSREKALAITKLEETFMWVGKAIRSDKLERDKK